MFTAFPAYSRYRTLRLADPIMVGADVYALQTALAALDFTPGVLDGKLGRQTSEAIVRAQQKLRVAGGADGLAGGATQKALALALAHQACNRHELASGALHGQVEHESGFRLGNYSPLRDDGSYDAGVAQRNTAHTPPPQGFDVPASIDALAALVREHYDLFAGLPPRRRWALAQGAWNAPAFACFIAREEGASGVPRGRTAQPGAAARKTFEAYVASVSTYLTV